MRLMLLAAILPSLIGAAAPGQTTRAASGNRIEVAADPRVELMCIIFRLAGNPEYNQPNSTSPYADEVEAHFGPFREHAVIATARRLRRTRGVSFDAVMSMAVHITDTEALAERIPFDEPPPRLDQRWKPDEARAFLEQARDFVAVTEFNRWIDEHADFYASSAARLRTWVEHRPYVDWFDGFFGARPGATFKAIPGLLCGGGNYGVGIRFPDGSEQITPVLGAWQFDEDGLPVFGESVTGTIAHELCHSYTNPLVDRFADDLQEVGEQLFEGGAEQMRRQAYGNWKTMMYESMVRSCTVRHALDAEGADAAEQEARRHERRGFRWIGELSQLLGEYEADRERYPGLEDFMPKVVAFFDDYAQRPAPVKPTGRAPNVVSMVPANGALDVDPALTEIRVTFDRPMQDESWSVVGGGTDFPETTGPPRYEAKRTVFVLPVRLRSGWTYRFQLNSISYTAFRSAKGVPLEPVIVTFSTRESD